MNAPRLFAALLLFALPAIATDVSVSVSPHRMMEDSGGEFVYTFTRTGAPTEVLTVNFTCANSQNNDFILSGTDVAFTPATGVGTITFQVGESTKALTVAPIADNEVEASETPTVRVTAASGGNLYNPTGNQATGMIVNDDGNVWLSGFSLSVSEDGGASLTMAPFRDFYTENTLTVHLTVSGTAALSGDYTHNLTSLDTQTGAATIVFPAGANSRLITFTPTADATVEADETIVVTVNANGPPAATGGYKTRSPTSSTGTIQNDDLPTVTLLAIDTQADENTADPGTWRISRDSTVGNLVVDLGIDAAGTAAANDFSQSGGLFASMAPGATGTVTIPDGESHVDIVLTPLPDSTPEENETIRLVPIPAAHYTLAPLLNNTLTISRNDFPFEVTHLNDAGEGSLRWVIENANTLGGDPTITFEGPVFATPQSITLASELPIITAGLTIQGPAAPLTISGDDRMRVLNIAVPDETVTLADLTIVNGVATFTPGGGVYCRAPSLTVLRCTFRDNRSGEGGGISYEGENLLVKDSTCIGNEAGQGGGIHVRTSGLPPYTAASPRALLINSTLSGNTANSGGGLLNSAGLTNVVNCTITGNSASDDSGGGIGTPGFTGSLSTRLANTLVVGNTGGDVSYLFVPNNNHVSLGGNLIGTGNAMDAFPGETTTALANTIMGPLDDYGGPTRTHSLLPGSPAVDKGVNVNAVDPFDAIFGDGNDLALTNDQRGLPRFTKGLATSATATVDIGAFELFAAPTFTNDALRIRIGSAPLDLTSATGVSPTGGTFRGPGVSAGRFDPSNLDPGVYLITYTATDPHGTTNRSSFEVEVIPGGGAKLRAPEIIRFTPTKVGTRSRVRFIEVTNTGEVAAERLRILVSGTCRRDFQVVRPVWRGIHPGNSTTLAVTFRPKLIGDRMARVQILSTAPTVTVALQGKGLRNWIGKPRFPK